MYTVTHLAVGLRPAVIHIQLRPAAQQQQAMEGGPAIKLGVCVLRRPLSCLRLITRLRVPRNASKPPKQAVSITALPPLLAKTAPKVHAIGQASQLLCKRLRRQVGCGHAQLPAACSGREGGAAGLAIGATDWVLQHVQQRSATQTEQPSHSFVCHPRAAHHSPRPKPLVTLPESQMGAAGWA